MEENRPDPDDLLALIHEEEAKSRMGKLKIFFGMCAGVGKTYSMLESARGEKKKGKDIIVGYVETHHRKETDSLLSGMEILPRKKYPYKGTVLEEMDLDSILSRAPEIVLVDELAHTNAPGSRHLKRYQDVQELLNQGISVYTTVNVQHIESKADTVAQITGITIRESFPDEIFEKADEIELVDITTEELIERFRAGKVYAPDQSKEALQNFFRTGNITALREMALRIVAERVDQQLRQYMQRKRLPGPWKSGVHLMVLIGPSPYSGRLIRWAKTLSYTMGASLLALYVEGPRTLTEAEQDQLNKNIKLARQLGADYITVSGGNKVRAILKVAQKENITHIIVGKPRHRTLISMLRLGSFLNRLVRHSGNIDMYILGSDVTTDTSYRRYLRPPTLKSGISQYLLSGFLIALTAAVCYPFARYMGYQVISFILLFVVSILALFLGIGPIIVASSMAALIWDFFFIPPSMTLTVAKPEDILMLSMFFFIALLNGVLTYRIRRQERTASHREEISDALYHLTRELSGAGEIGQVLETAVKAIRKYFTLESTFFIQDGHHSLTYAPRPDTQLTFTPNDFTIASWTYRNQKKAGRFTDTLPSTEYTFYPLPGARIRPGVLAVKHKSRLTGEQEIFWDTFITQIASSAEREFLDELAHKALLLDESDKLYKTLFSSISHELRIPVTTIMGAADTLLTDDHTPESRRKLHEEILIASERLNRLIENLLNISRLESGRIKPKLDWCDVNDLVSGVLENLQKETLDFTIETVISPDLPLVRLDFGLMEQVLHNLIYNATQHAKKGSTIRIKVYYDAPDFILQVMDRGPGFPKESLPYIFNKFYRVEGSRSVGTGLGLSIVKGFVEAHNGTVTAENRIHGGARFIVRIPSPKPDLNALTTEPA
ncbi:MAG TPA: sensor histidine kinase KdpD [Bacteroidales bacterium]|nr:sensor histidine kinase KdpD [Bacteroidales bacterium]